MIITRYAPGGAVAAASHLAASAGLAMLQRDGNAVDAAIAAAAVMAVTSPHMCGLGGDLFALVLERDRDPVALNASGRAGSGADPDRLRAEGAAEMPFSGDVRSVTVPGCVDGLVMLHERFASLTLAESLAPARRLADEGFPVSATLAFEAASLTPSERVSVFGSPARLVRGSRQVLAGVGAALGAVSARGRAGFYEGAAGSDLLALGGGEFTEDDLRARQADWVEPLSLEVFGRRLWTVPPNSQGYLALAGAWIASQAGLPSSVLDERWAFTLVEAARQAAFDRPAVLHEHAPGAPLVAASRLGPRAAAVRAAAVRARASRGLADVYGDGGTTHICAVDRERTGVSLIMSNAADFGSRLVLPSQGIVLHNRGMGFSLRAGQPGEYGPGRRPPHTLTPLAVTSLDGQLETVAGTMGGDAQPQVLLQLLARMFGSGEDPGSAVAAPRWVLSREPTTYFDLWQLEDPPLVRLEHDAPRSWAAGLRARGYKVVDSPPGDQAFGHAQVIGVRPDGMLAGAADPRSGDGSFAGWLGFGYDPDSVCGAGGAGARGPAAVGWHGRRSSSGGRTRRWPASTAWRPRWRGSLLPSPGGTLSPASPQTVVTSASSLTIFEQLSGRILASGRVLGFIVHKSLPRAQTLPDNDHDLVRERSHVMAEACGASKRQQRVVSYLAGTPEATAGPHGGLPAAGRCSRVTGAGSRGEGR